MHQWWQFIEIINKGTIENLTTSKNIKLERMLVISLINKGIL